jgi:hypothetical protein
MRNRLSSARAIARFLYVQRVQGFEAPQTPHLDPQTKQWFETRLRRTKLLLEFGSGGSTVLASRLGVPTISVESDRHYAATVIAALPRQDRIEMVVPPMGLTGKWGMPLFLKSKKGWRYVRAPFDRLGERFPDLVLVDGRYRVACALECAERSARAGVTADLMVDDYLGRPHYRVLEGHLGSPTMVGRAALFKIGEARIGEQTIAAHMTDPR